MNRSVKLIGGCPSFTAENKATKMALLTKRLALLPLVALAAWVLGAAAQAQTPVKVALHWNAPMAAFIPYYAAISQGFYKEEGLSVELQHLSGSTTVVTSVSRGDAQFGQSGGETILAGIAKGGPTIKAIFLLYQNKPEGIVVYSNSGIAKFSDFRGKTIASSVFGTEGKILAASLREASLDPTKDVNILNVSPGAKITMLLTKQADGAGAQINFQYIQAQMQNADVKFLPFSTPESPLYGHAIIANNKWLNANKEAASRFIRATIRGLVWSRAHIDESVDLVVKWDPTLKVDREFVKRDWNVEISDLISGGLARSVGLGHMEEKGWQSLADVLGENVNAKDVFTNEFIPADAPKW